MTVLLHRYDEITKSQNQILYKVLEEFLYIIVLFLDIYSKSPTNATHMVQKQLNSPTDPAMSHGTSQSCSTTMLNVVSGPSSSYLNNVR